MKTWKLNFKKYELLRGNSGKECTNLCIENCKVLLKKKMRILENKLHCFFT